MTKCTIQQQAENNGGCHSALTIDLDSKSPSVTLVTCSSIFLISCSSTCNGIITKATFYSYNHQGDCCLLLFQFFFSHELLANTRQKFTITSLVFVIRAFQFVSLATNKRQLTDYLFFNKKKSLCLKM